MLKEKYKQDKNKEWYAVLISRNGRMVWKTPETYKRRAGAEHAVQLLRDTFLALGLN